jgi:hypothetical protein
LFNLPAPDATRQLYPIDLSVNKVDRYFPPTARTNRDCFYLIIHIRWLFNIILPVTALNAAAKK